MSSEAAPSDLASAVPPSPEALAAALHPPRLPETFTKLTVWDLTTSLGLGLLIAALLLTLLAPLMLRRPRPVSLSQTLRRSAALPAEERMLVLTRLLRERGPALPPEQRRALYSGTGADPEGLEALLRQARAKRRRRAKTPTPEAGR